MNSDEKDVQTTKTAIPFAERLRKQRKRLGLTQAELGNLSGIARATMTLYERGRRFPDAETLFHICSVTGVTADYFLGLTDREGEFDFNTKEVAEKLNLSRDAVKHLMALSTEAPALGEVVSAIILSKSVQQLMEGVTLYHQYGSDRPAPSEEAILDLEYFTRKLMRAGYAPVPGNLAAEAVLDKGLSGLKQELKETFKKGGT